MSKLYRGLVSVVVWTGLGLVHAQVDPGVRGGAPGAGQPFSDLTAGELDFFTNHGVPQFTQVETFTDGLGPRFNLDSCGGCHVQPAVGGSSPPHNNPQVVRAHIMAPGNTVPPFLTLNGPIREVRFVRNPDGTPDGGVHDIFTIAGRSDKPTGCTISQPDFSNTGNMIFRIPTPTFGSGLIEAITDTTIRKNLASDPGGRKAYFGIKGHVNTNGNDGTVTRFGWKAQNKSLLIFAGEAYNVEMGVTNENFQNEREEDPNCATSATPESAEGFAVGSMSPGDILSFMGFIKFLDQPTPACTGSACSTSIQNGHKLFHDIGCVLCHTESLKTGLSTTAALSNKTANLFSDIAVHHMGSGLADGVAQGSARPDEFRTAPLWGVGQRVLLARRAYSRPAPSDPVARQPWIRSGEGNRHLPVRTQRVTEAGYLELLAFALAQERLNDTEVTTELLSRDCYVDDKLRCATREGQNVSHAKTTCPIKSFRRTASLRFQSL